MKKYQIAKKKTLTPEITQISVYAPLVAKKAKAGQFIILRVDEEGERIPLTISSAADDLVTVIFQKIGATTMALDLLNEGDCLHDFVGPLGVATEVEDLGRVAVLGGGLRCAIALPVARALHEAGNQVDLIGGFKTKDIVILEEEMSQACTDLHICTDDGSYGYAGFVTGKLEELIDAGKLRGVDAMRFGYGTCRDGDEWKLVPVWIVTCGYTNNPKSDKNVMGYYDEKEGGFFSPQGYGDYYFSAQTGEMLEQYAISPGEDALRMPEILTWSDVE